MNSKYFYAVALSIILVAGIGAGGSFAQLVKPITITTDKDTYAAGERITLTGEIRKLSQGAVSIKITAPNGNRVGFGQPNIDSNGGFTDTFVAGGPQWQTAGTYTIDANYGVIKSNAINAMTTIEYTGGIIDPVPTPPSEDPLAGITSSITGGTITTIILNEQPPGITVIIVSTDDGELVLTIPRTTFESKDNGNTGADIPFVVIVDDVVSNDVVETIGGDTRTLTIPFTLGTETIDIIGTWIIPEFGVIAIAILAVAIISIITLSSRSKSSILPRY